MFLILIVSLINVKNNIVYGFGPGGNANEISSNGFMQLHGDEHIFAAHFSPGRGSHASILLGIQSGWFQIQQWSIPNINGGKTNTIKITPWTNTPPSINKISIIPKTKVRDLKNAFESFINTPYSTENNCVTFASDIGNRLNVDQRMLNKVLNTVINNSPKALGLDKNRLREKVGI